MSNLLLPRQRLLRSVYLGFTSTCATLSRRYSRIATSAATSPTNIRERRPACPAGVSAPNPGQPPEEEITQGRSRRFIRRSQSVFRSGNIQCARIGGVWAVIYQWLSGFVSAIFSPFHAETRGAECQKWPLVD